MKIKTNPFSSIVVLTGLLAVTASSVQGQPSNGLVVYFPFNGNAHDASGNGNDGIVTGAMLTTDRFGVPSSAYAFSVSGQGIMTANTNGFPTAMDDFTVSLWVNVSSIGSDPHQVLLSNHAREQFKLHLGFSGSQAQIGFQTGGTGAASTPLVQWTLNRWYNVQLVRSQNTITIYRDRVQLSSQTTSLGNQAVPEKRPITLGYDPTYASPIQQLYGSLDDLRIYNRALTSNELKQLLSLDTGPQLTRIKQSHHLSTV